MAAELRPVRMPLITAHGLILWTAAAFAASIAVWCQRVADLLGSPSWSTGIGGLRYWIVAFAAMSGVGSLVLVRPQAKLPRRMTLMSIGGCILYLPLCLALYRIHCVMDVHAPTPYGIAVQVRLDRTVLHLTEVLVLGAILLLLRPAARHLQARSFLMRTGRVDRQTMAAMLAVLGLIALGDLLMLGAGGGGGPVQDILRQVGQLVILLGSLLLSLGLLGMLVDTVRMRGVILEPPLSLEQLVGGAVPTPPPSPSHPSPPAPPIPPANTSA